MFTTVQKAKKAGWFSRRNHTSEAHEKARQTREDERITKFQNAQKRNEEAANRPPCEQLHRLDQRLGAGVGAKKERARLKALIS